MRVRWLLLGLLAAPALVAAQTQAFPTKAMRLIVPFPPGGSADILARTIGQEMAKGLGQPVVVENRPGAGTAIGATATAKADPDGYTFMIGTVSSHAINPSLNPKLAYDPIKDFTPISIVASIPFALVVHPSVQAESVAGLIALARSRPGAMNFASAGNGTSNHLAGELFKSMTRLDLVHIPYKGSAPALADLLAGQVDMMFDLVLTAAPHVRSGAVRALGVTGATRSSVLPQVPTVAEAGVPGYEVSAWFGIFAPAKLAPPITQRLNAEVVRVMKLPEVNEKLSAQGTEALSSTSEAFAAYVRTERDKWGQVVRSAGMRID